MVFRYRFGAVETKEEKSRAPLPFFLLGPLAHLYPRGGRKQEALLSVIFYELLRLILRILPSLIHSYHRVNSQPVKYKTRTLVTPTKQESF